MVKTDRIGTVFAWPGVGSSSSHGAVKRTISQGTRCNSATWERGWAESCRKDGGKNRPESPGRNGPVTCGTFSSPVSPIGKQDKAAAGKFRDNGCELSKTHEPFGLSGNSAVSHS